MDGGSYHSNTNNNVAAKKNINVSDDIIQVEWVGATGSDPAHGSYHSNKITVQPVIAQIYYPLTPCSDSDQNFHISLDRSFLVSWSVVNKYESAQNENPSQQRLTVTLYKHNDSNLLPMKAISGQTTRVTRPDVCTNSLKVANAPINFMQKQCTGISLDSHSFPFQV